MYISYLVPSGTVLGNDLVTVAEPVPVPSPESGRVVNTNSVNVLNLKSSALKVVDEEAEWGRGIGTREDVSIHEEAPDEVLVLPGLTETSNLEEEDTVIVKHLIDLLQEGLEVADTDVLGHLQAGDLVVQTSWNWDIAVVHAEDLALLLGDTGLA
jgi:hypothetical protein